MVKVDSKVLKALSRVCAKEMGRYAIAGVNVRSDRVESTDGRMMLVGKASDDGVTEHKTRIIGLASIKQVLADRIVKKAGEVNITSNGTMHATVEAGELPIPIVDAEFPNTSGIALHGEPTFKVGISPILLRQLAEACMDLDESQPCVEFEFGSDMEGKPDATGPIHVRMGKDARAVYGYVMPMSL